MCVETKCILPLKFKLKKKKVSTWNDKKWKNEKKMKIWKRTSIKIVLDKCVKFISDKDERIYSIFFPLLN